MRRLCYPSPSSGNHRRCSPPFFNVVQDGFTPVSFPPFLQRTSEKHSRHSSLFLRPCSGMASNARVLPSGRAGRSFAAVGAAAAVLALLALLLSGARAPPPQRIDPADWPAVPAAERDDDGVDFAAGIDAIFVPGGGSQRGPSPTSLPAAVRARLDAAAALYFAETARRRRVGGGSYGDSDGGPSVVALSAGTPHRPNYVDAHGRPVLESSSGAAYLTAVRGVPPSAVLRETASLDTLGNAFFVRTVHAEPNAGVWRRLVVVTSKFHMARTRAVFEVVFGLPQAGCADLSPVNAPSAGPSVGRWVLQFLSVPDAGLGPAALAARRAREAASLASFQRLVASRFAGAGVGVTARNATAPATLQTLHRFLHREHRAYRTPDAAAAEDAPALPASVLDSY